MTDRQIWFSDLTHTAQGVSAATFPLGVSYVMSYAKSKLGNDFAFSLFKFPNQLEEAIRSHSPEILCFSNYSWNFELAYKFASIAKERSSDLITVFGGPNFPTTNDEKLSFLDQRPNIDFYVELEGELGFVDLVENLAKHGFDQNAFKSAEATALNTTYSHENRLIAGPVERIRDINEIPSPYLTGLMDEYFDHPLVPMIETTRGCPFSCSFCADGLESKNKVFRYDSDRTKDELEYVANRVRNVDELIITDLNFAMYKQDLVTAEAVAEVQRKYGYPTLMSASAGKNKPQRTIEVASIINGWTLGASIQSSDPTVLSAINRSNISSAAYKELIEYGNNVKNSKTHSEIILGLPEDSREKHFESLRFGTDNNVNSMRMFQAMLLSGTEMASPATREKHGLITKFRTIPGCIGIYNILGQDHGVAEIEEIIVGSNTLSVEDYIDCRIMNLVLETFHNNATFEELFAMVRSIGESEFDCLLYLKEHPELYSARFQTIVDEFVVETSEDLFDTFEESKEYVLTPEIIEQYIGGELGTNELLLHRALLFKEFDDICELIFASVKGCLEEKGVLTDAINQYLDELKILITLRKKDPFEHTESVSHWKFSYDFEAIGRADFKVNPNDFQRNSEPIELEFFHDDTQKQHIANQVRLYSTSPIGLGRLLQRSNLKLIFRNFAQPTADTRQ